MLVYCIQGSSTKTMKTKGKATPIEAATEKSGILISETVGQGHVPLALQAVG